ncbi:ParB/Srx family N-terminal domain-containing protein [Mesorhizobium sp.]|uniref:ParB/Srx family N-terminal domain-containing protein n=1 Tax=Mesorhizobium sp. TaxID=1871066 RepID=UPI00344EDED2
MAVARTKRQSDRLEPSNAEADQKPTSSNSIALDRLPSRSGEKPSISGPTVQSRVIEQIPPGRLKPHASNAKTHSKKQIGQIAKWVKRFGFQNPVIVNADNVILAGHGRAEAAKLLGMSQSHVCGSSGSPMLRNVPLSLPTPRSRPRRPG